MTIILPVFRNKFPAEGAIIGRLVAGYADLEVDLFNCVQVAHGDFNGVLKAMFRTRGEAQRIKVADGLARSVYHDLGLGTDFEMAIGAMFHCKNIRNQYAHCIWWDDYTDRLGFANMEEAANENGHVSSLRGLTRFVVTLDLLQHQEAYFSHTGDLLAYVNYEGRLVAGKLKLNPVPKPAQLERPDLRLP